MKQTRYEQLPLKMTAGRRAAIRTGKRQRITSYRSRVTGRWLYLTDDAANGETVKW